MRAAFLFVRYSHDVIECPEISSGISGELFPGEFTLLEY